MIADVSNGGVLPPSTTLSGPFRKVQNVLHVWLEEMKMLRRHMPLVFATILATFGCTYQQTPIMPASLAKADVRFVIHDLTVHQELVNDAPLGPGKPQPSDHCPTGPGRWIAGSGRSTGISNVFGDLKETETYCINADHSELSGGRAVWIDDDGDSIHMAFGAKLLVGDVYEPTPKAPMIGYAHFTGGTGKWRGIAGEAILTGNQNGDGTATITYRGSVYVPK